MIINLEAASCQFHLSLKTKRSFGSFDFSTVTRRLELLPITSKGIFFSITPQWDEIICEDAYLKKKPSYCNVLRKVQNKLRFSFQSMGSLHLDEITCCTSMRFACH